MLRKLLLLTLPSLALYGSNNNPESFMTLRNETISTDCWNVDSMYPSLNHWKEEFKLLSEIEGKLRFPALATYRGRLGEGPGVVAEALNALMDTSRTLEKLYTYIHLRHDEDITNDEHKAEFGKIYDTLMSYEQERAWFEPELLALPNSVLETYLQSPQLADYRFHIEKIIRLRDHTLSEKEEELLALGGNALSVSQKAFSALNDADLNFGTAIDSEGNEHSITHASYISLLRSTDRTLRENAYKNLNKQYGNHANTLSELLNGQVQAHIFNARAHNYKSCLDAALYPNNIDTSVYHSLLKAVDHKLPLLHKYTRLRKQVLGVEELYPYDMYCPLISNVDINMEYAEAEQLVIDSVAPLGEEYQSLLRKGLIENRWVDRYENQNKRSGAYSSGCYDSEPFILLNYKGLLRDVFTLAHEAGHSMHSLLSRKHQPYHYSSYPIFLAEVASTFNEELLSEHLLEKMEDPRVRAYLLNERIEDLRGTLLRQAMFAQFELAIHSSAEKGEPLTPASLKGIYKEINSNFFGPDVVIDEEGSMEWARIPHFYYNFYVYQYATGISAAVALSEKVLKGGEKEREDYLSFLKGGCSAFPIEQLRCAGVDLSTPQPVETALELFGKLVDELEKTLDILASKS